MQTPREIATDVYLLEVGSGIMRSNVYLVRAGSAWALIDTGAAGCAGVIEDAAKQLAGPNLRPSAILLTHDHPDHAGSAHDLVERWGCPVLVHPDEMRFVTVDATTFFEVYKPYTTPAASWQPPPLDRWIVLPLMRLMPRSHAAMLSRSSVRGSAVPLESSGVIPNLPGWEWVSTPGHTPGHVAFFRRSDRVLIAGDSVVTVELNSPAGFLLWAVGQHREKLSRSPWYFTWSQDMARASLQTVAELEPLVLATGHGPPMAGAQAGLGLRNLAARSAH